MNISNENYELVLEEFKKVQELCKDTENPEDTLYYFSASYGVLNRVMNFQCEPILIFMHQVLQDTHTAISKRLAVPKKPDVLSQGLPRDMFESIFSYFTELITAFEDKNENNIREILQKFVNLTYATTGNGFYLYLRKKLTL